MSKDAMYQYCVSFIVAKSNQLKQQVLLAQPLQVPPLGPWNDRPIFIYHWAHYFAYSTILRQYIGLSVLPY
jgi:hypothetical protein